MAERYEFRALEDKWQKRWEEQGLYRTTTDSSRPKHYALTMLPYPSGDLHIGHWYAMAPSDARARYQRMRGYNVFFPLGFDAFGLPAENAAIKRGIHPYNWTMSNIERMRGQLRSMGTMVDWSHEVVTCDPAYYRWNQWFFLKMFEKGLAYKKKSPVDWCPSCKTTLAREQVVGEERLCERCDTPVTKKDLDQWFFKITDYAEELLDFSGLDWPERVITMQRNWIGRSEGVEFRFRVKDHRADFSVFTTRIDTIYGVSFCVLAPEHPLVEGITTPDRKEQVEAYRARAARQTEIERLSTERVRDGVFTGAYAEHPLTGRDVPIYIADYVLMSYGTGAIMAVPGHDERDFDFARRYDLPVPVVIAPPDWDGSPLTKAYTGEGRLVNSGPYDGRPSEEGWQEIANELERRGIGRRTVQYRIRDWLISRQRYWGTPIPVVYCEACGIVPIPAEELPVRLPEDAEFLPTGESPLKSNTAFIKTKCPKCAGPAERETDTMDTFVDSSWYQYRYLSPDYERAPFDPEESRYWLPVDQYTGGVEHAVMHLLYTRFFTKVLRDLGLVDFDEPMTRLYNQGIILGEDGNRMSKSRGNVVAPDDLVAEHGADAVRLYLMFMAPWDQGGPWSPAGMGGASRFVNRVWRLVTGDIENDVSAGAGEEDARSIERLTHHTVKRVTDDFEGFRFNTAIAAMMELTNGLVKTGPRLKGTPEWEGAIDTLLLLLAPITPHLCEELWERRGQRESVHLQDWPEYDPAALILDEVEVVVQVNGKVRDRMRVAAGLSEDDLKDEALAQERIRQMVDGKELLKAIIVPDKLVNLVLK